MRRESHVRICGGDGQEIGRLYPEIEDTLVKNWAGVERDGVTPLRSRCIV